MNEKIMLRKNLYILIFLNLSIIAFAVFYTLIFTFINGTEREISCLFKEIFGLYCPGCGGSRSLYYFLRFSFVRSFILYPPITFGALVVLDYDIRLSITLIKKNTALTDRFRFYTFLLIPISIILTFIIRNILLIVFKIDTVGDFL